MRGARISHEQLFPPCTVLNIHLTISLPHTQKHPRAVCLALVDRHDGSANPAPTDPAAAGQRGQLRYDTPVTSSLLAHSAAAAASFEAIGLIFPRDGAPLRPINDGVQYSTAATSDSVAA